MSTTATAPPLVLPAPTRTAGGTASATKQQAATLKASETGGALVAVSDGRKTTTTKKKATRAPSYEERCRAAMEHSKLSAEERKRRGPLFVPRSLKDFDDGGAFPEIHVAQYPRHMGNPHLANGGRPKPQLAAEEDDKKDKKKKKSGTDGTITALSNQQLLNVEIDEKGEVSYDAIVTGGTNADKKVYARHQDLRGYKPSAEELALPSAEEEEETRRRTQAALMGLVDSQVLEEDKPTGTAMAVSAQARSRLEQTQFIHYEADPNAPGYNPVAAKRVIQMIPAQVDPMMPPKHLHRKAPRGPEEDPVPVLHAPPTRLTKEERAAWQIPACISNWKNTRGYTIPLDKRLAADGRGLREHSINGNFATLSESLYVAERQAREEVRLRSQVQKRLALQERERREEELRQLANKARMERGSAAASAGGPKSTEVAGTEQSRGGAGLVDYDDDDDDDDLDNDGNQTERPTKVPDDSEDNDEERRRRDEERMERRREIERELRMEKRGGKKRGPDAADFFDKDDDDNDNEAEEIKRQRLEADRDISEKIALGTHTGRGGAGDGVDARLYNQSSGLDSGFGADDEYTTYSKPLFGDANNSGKQYKPHSVEDADDEYDKLREGATKRFQPHEGFQGASGGAGSSARRSEHGPVEFEKGA